jgi:hypothetical protein
LSQIYKDSFEKKNKNNITNLFFHKKYHFWFVQKWSNLVKKAIELNHLPAETEQYTIYSILKPLITFILY